MEKKSIMPLNNLGLISSAKGFLNLCKDLQEAKQKLINAQQIVTDNEERIRRKKEDLRDQCVEHHSGKILNILLESSIIRVEVIKPGEQSEMIFVTHERIIK